MIADGNKIIWLFAPAFPMKSVRHAWQIGLFGVPQHSGTAPLLMSSWIGAI
jgi:hypothetical protein